ncbi:hypothetical protein [Bacillus sp. JCM 19034]|uniref:hypothetical protein n=1 Tax=Bacillus sp. JCM 19034 TaxID=1481928 RepID=UPI0007831C1D|nr:hypothetical protein [Bacillus sp. JCM 19034]
MKIIPIYSESKNNQQGYTILIDEHKEKSYKAFHKKSNQWVYWIGFFFTLAILRSIQDIHITISYTTSVIIYICLLVLTILISRVISKHFYYDEVKEIYLTKTMIEEYIEDGKSIYRIEVWIASISFFIFAILCTMFFINFSLVALLFSIVLFFIFCLSLKRLPLARIKLYKK